MPKRLHCHCAKSPLCKLCQATGFYKYEWGPLGWQPFRCPTCDGSGNIADSHSPDGKSVCPTCNAKGSVDPANAPGGGFWDLLSKIFMGA